MKKTLLIVLFITGFCFGQTYELAEEFYSNGFPKVIKTYKVSKDKIELVKEIEWYKQGQKSEERNYKDGKLDGLVTGWYENGQKEFEGTYKNGELDGFVTGWWSNGQKWYERTFKDGELISVKKWNEDGNLIEK